MSYLNLSSDYLEANGAIHTAREICQQPEIWEKTYLKLLNEKDQLLSFLQKVWNIDHPHIILSGAGTSAFIGESLTGSFQKKLGINCRAVSTTDIVSHPDNYFIKKRPTLLISFARSGNSPESLHTSVLARQFCDELYELNITCNAEGALAKQVNTNNLYTILLPEETNDESLAMTSSYSSMLLAGLFVAYIHETEKLKPIIEKVCQMGNLILSKHVAALKDISAMDFDRMVFLGSGPLFGVAHESHLKVQELSNGKVICKFDSFLGFRHGPKAVVNEKTVIVYLFSTKSYPRLYELDLVRSVKETAAGEKSIAIGNGIDNKEFQFDMSIQFPDEINELPEEFLSLFYILPAQIIGFYKSLNLGLSPDSPSKNGAISRVVQGVEIYQFIK